MKNEKKVETVIKSLEKLLRKNVEPLFKRYGLQFDSLLTPLKWQPLVLIIGNYSSGKSTFINELLGRDVQRTGQAPTDDCFTILAKPEAGESEKEIPGSTIVNDERLPFSSLRNFGESLLAHLRLKKVNAPILEHFAIIDTPGMLDSVTEKDRGYDYLGVVSELARLADIIILMFDPHKAGTIKETYEAIRTTLPGSTGEDRVIYVMNRIDECDNITDLVRSYGTLCWNLSQMTGRKDMPVIYLTCVAPDNPGPTDTIGVIQEGVEVWENERDDLKKAVAVAPKMKLNHILQEVDRGVRELALMLEALAAFKTGAFAKLKTVWKWGALAALVVFLLGDIAAQLLTGLPETTLLGTVFTGTLTRDHLLWPTLGAVIIIAVVSILVRRLIFPSYVRSSLQGIDRLIPLETAYKRDLWQRVRGRVQNLITTQPRIQCARSHLYSLRRIENFLEKDLRSFFEKIQVE